MDCSTACRTSMHLGSEASEQPQTDRLTGCDSATSGAQTSLPIPSALQRGSNTEEHEHHLGCQSHIQWSHRRCKHTVWFLHGEAVWFEQLRYHVQLQCCSVLLQPKELCRHGFQRPRHFFLCQRCGYDTGGYCSAVQSSTPPASGPLLHSAPFQYGRLSENWGLLLWPYQLQAGIETNFNMNSPALSRQLASFVAGYGTHYRESCS